MNIAIVRTFIPLRKTTPGVPDIRQQMDELKEQLGEHDIQLAQIYKRLENLPDEHADKGNGMKEKELVFYHHLLQVMVENNRTD